MTGPTWPDVRERTERLREERGRERNIRKNEGIKVYNPYISLGPS